MAKSLNRAQIIGNLGADPELRAIPSGAQVCTLNVATTESYKDKNGEWQEITEWHRVVLWERLAEIAEKYLNKGSKVFIEGRIQTRSWEKDGITRYTTEIRANNLILLDGRQKGDSFSQESPPTQEKPDKSAPEDEEEDDVPF